LLLLVQHFAITFTHHVTRRVDYVDSAGDIFEGYLAYDGNSSQKRPALLVAHNVNGLISEFQLRAEEFAGWGYVGLAIDMYGKGKIAIKQ